MTPTALELRAEIRRLRAMRRSWMRAVSTTSDAYVSRQWRDNVKPVRRWIRDLLRKLRKLERRYPTANR